jgi:hypothetical protein
MLDSVKLFLFSCTLVLASFIEGLRVEVDAWRFPPTAGCPTCHLNRLDRRACRSCRIVRRRRP